jgi:hypothetical protein
VGASLAAIGVHSLFYNAFFEDPMMWGLLALAAVAAAAREPAAEPAAAEPVPDVPVPARVAVMKAETQ